ASPAQAFHRRLKRDASDQPLRAPPGDERSWILAAGQGLQPLAVGAELCTDRRSRQRGELAHGGQPKERESLPGLRIRRKQGEGKRRQHRSRGLKGGRKGVECDRDGRVGSRGEGESGGEASMSSVLTQ